MAVGWSMHQTAKLIPRQIFRLYGMGMDYVHPDPCAGHINYISPANCWLHDARFSANELCTVLEEPMLDLEDDVCIKLLCEVE